MGVVETDRLAADAFDPELGRLAAGRRIECGIRQCRQIVSPERHQPIGVGWRTGSPAEV